MLSFSSKHFDTVHNSDLRTVTVPSVPQQCTWLLITCQNKRTFSKKNNSSAIVLGNANKWWNTCSKFTTELQKNISVTRHSISQEFEENKERIHVRFEILSEWIGNQSSVILNKYLFLTLLCYLLNDIIVICLMIALLSVTCLEMSLFHTLLHKGTIFRNVIWYKKGALIFAATFVRNIYGKKNSSIPYHKSTYVFMWSTCYSCQNLISIQFSRRIFEIYSRKIFNKICPVSPEFFHADGRKSGHQMSETQQLCSTIFECT